MVGLEWGGLLSITNNFHSTVQELIRREISHELNGFNHSDLGATQTEGFSKRENCWGRKKYQKLLNYSNCWFELCGETLSSAKQFKLDSMKNVRPRAGVGCSECNLVCKRGSRSVILDLGDRLNARGVCIICLNIFFPTRLRLRVGMPMETGQRPKIVTVCVEVRR